MSNHIDRSTIFNYSTIAMGKAIAKELCVWIPKKGNRMKISIFEIGNRVDIARRRQSASGTIKNKSNVIVSAGGVSTGIKPGVKFYRNRRSYGSSSTIPKAATCAAQRGLRVGC